MIHLSKRNWWVRMAYGNDVPYRTDICRLFWRGVGALIRDVVLAVLVSLPVSFLASMVIYDWREVGLAFLWITGVLGTIALFVVTAAWADEGGVRRAANRIAQAVPEVPREAFKSWKERHCALVRIED